jgi:hypothetical protein
MHTSPWSSQIGLVFGLVTCLMLPALSEAGQGDTTLYDASYFRRLLDKESAAGIVNRLYVAPPDLMTPLFSGIGTGSAEWIDVYDRCRKGVDSADLSGVTKARLDDALASALSMAPERVLSYLREHTEIPVRQICDRNAWQVDDPAGVLKPRELLAMVRRQRRLASVSDPGLQKQQAECLAAASQRLRRQMRIFFVSFGANDSKAVGSSQLSETERQELESAVAAAHKDPSLRAQGQGTFPDGPFRTKRVPRGVLASCAEGLADPEGPWEFSDMITDPGLPRARLLSACQVAADEWDLTCEKGGFAPYFRHVRARKIQGLWRVVQEDDGRCPRANQRPALIDLWPDCRALSKSTTPSNPPLQTGGASCRL